MHKLFGSIALITAVLLGLPNPATSGELRLSIANGRVTLVAHDVSVRQILDEWARIGQTRIVNAEKQFLTKLKGVTDPEKKRKIIGAEFHRCLIIIVVAVGRDHHHDGRRGRVLALNAF